MEKTIQPSNIFEVVGGGAVALNLITLAINPIRAGCHLKSISSSSPKRSTGQRHRRNGREEFLDCEYKLIGIQFRRIGGKEKN